ncbi:unnamed protein product, partial [Heterotrigona itama]
MKLSIAPTGLPGPLISVLLTVFLDTGTWASGRDPVTLPVPEAPPASVDSSKNKILPARRLIRSMCLLLVTYCHRTKQQIKMMMYIHTSFGESKNLMCAT